MEKTHKSVHNTIRHKPIFQHRRECVCNNSQLEDTAIAGMFQTLFNYAPSHFDFRGAKALFRLSHYY